MLTFTAFSTWPHKPLMNTSPWGEYVFEWWGPYKQRKLTLYVRTDGTADFVKVWGPDVDTEMESGEVNKNTSTADLFSWLSEDCLDGEDQERLRCRGLSLVNP